MGWIKDAWRTLSDALGVRKYLVSATATALAGFLAFAYGQLYGMQHMSWAPYVPAWCFFVIALLMFLLFVLLQHATHLRKSAPDNAAELELKRRAVEAQEEHTRAIDRQTRQHASDNEPFLRALRQKEADALFGRRSNDVPALRSDGLQILHENTAEYEKVQPRQDYVIRTCFVVAHNRDMSRSLANCEARLVYNNHDVPLADNFTLTPGEKRRIPVVIHHEFHGDKYIHVLGPRAAGYFAEAFRHYDLPLTATLLALKITSTESVAAEQIFRVFIDDSGKLKMERA